MTYDLYIGDRLFSSWSLRGWLMFEKFNIPCHTHLVGLYSGTMAQDLQPVAPARLVPCMRMPDGAPVGESLAMAETLAELHPEANLWPQAPAARATARWLCAEMAAGFGDLRGQCPMQLLHSYAGFAPSEGTQRDLSRIETLWSHARQISGAQDGPLFGAYSLADVFYTPVAARIVGYGLPVSTENRAYCEALLTDPAVLAWREKALEVTYDPFPYPVDAKIIPWPLS
ncbi:glutathione S-transferase [Ruegeria sp. 2205SS24-7]|uniref:glutathione S-transferase n=1 Tax=Ruegeria discodermiae TaxID=3064389 RepID=UPI0027421459|nr:glutathione S-transferase [Ruegeria sp. 2205SS24-7]MDP5217398.1 glutathione S-transferase [Ruegeria sp. 2205SS24-7]